MRLQLIQHIRDCLADKLGEDIKFSFVPLEKAVSMCMDNTICVNGTVAAILKTARIYGV